MKKILSFVMAVVASVSFFCSTETTAFNFPLTSQIKSEFAMVINLDSNLTIHEKTGDV